MKDGRRAMQLCLSEMVIRFGPEFGQVTSQREGCT